MIQDYLKAGYPVLMVRETLSSGWNAWKVAGE